MPVPRETATATTASTSLADAVAQRSARLETPQPITCSAAAIPDVHEEDDGLSSDEEHLSVGFHQRRSRLSSRMNPFEDAVTGSLNVTCRPIESDDQEDAASDVTEPHAVEDIAHHVDELHATATAKDLLEYPMDDWDAPGRREIRTTDIYSSPVTVTAEPEDTNEGEASSVQAKPRQPALPRAIDEEPAIEEVPAEREVPEGVFFDEHGDPYYYPEDFHYNPDCDCPECLDHFQWVQSSGYFYGPMPRMSEEEREEAEREAQQRRQMSRRSLNGTPGPYRSKPAENQQPPKSYGPNPTVMCCYFKQHGKCKMGADCWYSHDGDENTPCHYGAFCKAGHRHLVKTGAASAPAARPMAAGGRAQAPRARPTLAPAVPRSSAPLEMSDLPCAYCGGSDCVQTQEFPAYEGNMMVTAKRAHCLKCLRTYAL